LKYKSKYLNLKQVLSGGALCDGRDLSDLAIAKRTLEPQIENFKNKLNLVENNISKCKKVIVARGVKTDDERRFLNLGAAPPTLIQQKK